MPQDMLELIEGMALRRPTPKVAEVHRGVERDRRGARLASRLGTPWCDADHHRPGSWPAGVGARWTAGLSVTVAAGHQADNDGIPPRRGRSDAAGGDLLCPRCRGVLRPFGDGRTPPSAASGPHRRRPESTVRRWLRGAGKPGSVAEPAGRGPRRRGPPGAAGPARAAADHARPRGEPARRLRPALPRSVRGRRPAVGADRVLRPRPATGTRAPAAQLKSGPAEPLPGPAVSALCRSSTPPGSPLRRPSCHTPTTPPITGAALLHALSASRALAPGKSGVSLNIVLLNDLEGGVTVSTQVTSSHHVRLVS